MTAFTRAALIAEARTWIGTPALTAGITASSWNTPNPAYESSRISR